ncbi:MAG TPA: hypothetical protein VGN96_03225, partial [Roseococcus sp.]|nr:hypothetical protein [Roseococcus sp.]
MTERFLSLRLLPAEALDGYAACLQDVLALLDRVATQPAIAHAPALRVVLEDRAAMVPGLRAMLSPKATVVHGPLAPEAAPRAWQATGPSPSPLSPAEAEWPWTPERDAALLEWSATTQDDVLLLDVVNALPGPQVDSRAAVRTRLEWLRHQADATAQTAEAAQEGLADAVADATPLAPEPAPQAKRARRQPPGRTAPKWSPERLALLREKAGKMRGRDLLTAINALPGLPIASTGAMRVKMRELGLESAPGLPPLPENFDPRGQDEASREAMRERARRLAVAGGLGDWTEERLALLRAEYATVEDTGELLTRINALPGNPIASTESMRHKAASLGVRRPRPGSNPAHMAKMNAARSMQAAAMRGALEAPAPAPDDAPEMVEAEDTAPEPAPPAPTIKPDVKVYTPATIQPRSLKATTPWIAAAIAPVAAELDPWASTSPHRLTEAAEAEALAMLRAGQGAKALHEEFGGR